MSTASHAQRQLKRFVAYPLQAALVYALYGFFRLMPVDTASAVGGWLGRCIGPHLGASRKVRRNLAKAMPELGEARLHEIVQGMWDNLGRIMAEYPHLASFTSPRVEVIGEEHVEAARASGRPFIMASGHFANWETLPVLLHQRAINAQLVYRHANNPYVDRLLQRARTPGGTRFARKGVQGARSVYGAMRKGEAVGMLVDQKHNRGLSIPFFGRPAMTATAVAELTLKYNAPLLLGRIERLNGAHFRVTMLPPMPTEGLSVEDILTRINTTFEGWIRERPEQWLWLHRRWND